MIKAFTKLIFCGSLIFIIACRSEIQDKSPESIRGLKLNINIDNFNETDINKQSTVKTESGNTNNINRQEFRSGVFDVISELSSDNLIAKKISLISPKSFLSKNIVFCIIAYDTQSGDYLAHDYGSTSNPDKILFSNFNLVGNKKYTFVTYSLNNSSLRQVVPTTNLNTAKLDLFQLNGDESGTDLLYAINENILLSGGNTSIDVTLKHQFSRISISIDTGDAVGILGQPDYIKGGYPLKNNMTGGFTGIIPDFYTSLRFNLKNATVTEGLKEGLQVKKISTSETKFIINTGKNADYKSKLIIPTGAVVIGKDINKAPINIAINGPNNTGLQSGKSYTLKLKFNSDRYTDNSGVTTSKTFGKYAVIAGYRWARFNLGVINSNPAVYNPDIPRKEIHGAKYHWGAYSGENGRYYSQQQDQDNPSVIPEWSITPLPEKSWNSGTESNPIRTSRDPCSALDSGGLYYRIPTATEYKESFKYTSSEQIGFPATNPNITTHFEYAITMRSKKSKNIALTFPAAGTRIYQLPYWFGHLIRRGIAADYWTSTEAIYVQHPMSYIVQIETDGSPKGNSYLKATGFPVRCIQD
ncbi:fimbrillin family protein [Elizabethkingia miricola]|uniref:fimbrillin family protein n=1 Tax=Elizabethkingia miricola TaxID=172045 RepID=UPI0011777695|nr:fimbrillin family protein [Elizabethkingia miricola]